MVLKGCKVHTVLFYYYKLDSESHKKNIFDVLQPNLVGKVDKIRI